LPDPSADPSPTPKELEKNTKWEIYKFYKHHGLANTLGKYPEVSKTSLFRLIKESNQLSKAVHSGEGQSKREKTPNKYKVLGEQMYAY